MASPIPTDQVLILSANHISQLLLQIPLSTLLANQADVFRCLSASTPPSTSSGPSPADTTSTNAEDGIQCPARTAVAASKHTVLFMPARARGTTSIKCVAVPRPSLGLAPGVGGGIPGTTLLFHRDSSRVRAVVNASELTAVRTAAGSVLATVLALPPRSASGRAVRDVAVFGGGMQGFYHAWLLCGMYEELERVTFVLTRGTEPSKATRESMERLQRSVEGKGISVRCSDRVEATVREAEVVCCCTPSDRPLLQAEWVKRGTHLNIVGAYKPHMVELPGSLVQAAAATSSLLVDSVEACSTEAGDLIQAGVKANQMVELGRVLPREATDWATLDRRPSSWHQSEGISIFKSVGVAVQDVAITALLVDQAEQDGVGQMVDFF